MNFDELPDVLTVDELRQYLRVGRDRAYKIAGEIPHIKNGNRRLIPKENVRQWMLGQSESPLQKRLRAVNGGKRR